MKFIKKVQKNALFCFFVVSLREVVRLWRVVSVLPKLPLRSSHHPRLRALLRALRDTTSPNGRHHCGLAAINLHTNTVPKLLIATRLPFWQKSTFESFVRQDYTNIYTKYQQMIAHIIFFL